MLLTLCGFKTMLVITFATGAVLVPETLPSYAVTNPPFCQNNKGEPVLFENKMSPKAKSAAGIAKPDDKGLSVIYRFAYTKSPQSLQKFIDQPHLPRNSPDHMKNESIDDCIAILRMRAETTDSQTQI